MLSLHKHPFVISACLVFLVTGFLSSYENTSTWLRVHLNPLLEDVHTESTPLSLPARLEVEHTENTVQSTQMSRGLMELQPIRRQE